MAVSDRSSHAASAGPGHADETVPTATKRRTLLLALKASRRHVRRLLVMRDRERGVVLAESHRAARAAGGRDLNRIGLAGRGDVQGRTLGAVEQRDRWLAVDRCRGALGAPGEL